MTLSYLLAMSFLASVALLLHFLVCVFHILCFVLSDTRAGDNMWESRASAVTEDLKERTNGDDLHSWNRWHV